MKLSSRAFLEGFYHKPRIDRELLESPQRGDHLPERLRLGRTLAVAVGGQEETGDCPRPGDRRPGCAVFGDRYFIEIQNNGLEIQKQAARAVGRGGQADGPADGGHVRCPLRVAGGRGRRSAALHQHGKFRTDTNRMRMEGDEFYIRSQQEMYVTFTGLEDAVARSQQIADSVDIQLELGKRHFPSFSCHPRKRRPITCWSCAKPGSRTGIRGRRTAGLAAIRNRASFRKKCGTVARTASCT